MNEQEVNQTPSPTPNPNTKKYIIIGIVVLVVIVMAQSFLSPARLSERALERATGGDYDIDIDRDGTVQVRGENGEEVNISGGENVSLPSDWPSNVPIISDAVITYAGSVNGGDGSKNITAAYTTRRSAADTAEYYKEELESNGWTIEGTVATGEGSMITASQGENESVAVIISAADGQTAVSITTQVSQ